MRQNNETTRRGFLSRLSPIGNLRELRDGVSSLGVLGEPSDRATTGDQETRSHITGVTRRAALTLIAEGAALAGLIYAGTKVGAIGLKELSGEVTEEDIQDFLSMEWNYTQEWEPGKKVDYTRRPEKVSVVNGVLEEEDKIKREDLALASNGLPILSELLNAKEAKSGYLWASALRIASVADDENADLKSICYSPLGNQVNLKFSDGNLAPYYYNQDSSVVVPTNDFIPNIWASVMMFEAVQVGRVYRKFSGKELDSNVVVTQSQRSAYEFMQVASDGRLAAVLGSVAWKLKPSLSKSKDAFFADVDTELASAQQHFAPGFDCECMKDTNPAYMLEIKRILAIWFACVSGVEFEVLMREYVKDLDRKITARKTQNRKSH